MRYVVYDVAAVSGGALSVLSSFYDDARVDSENHYLFLLSEPSFDNQYDNIEIRRYPWIKKSIIHRLLFDYLVAPCTVRKWKADGIISLQNTCVPRVKVPQTVYLHNALPKPFCDFRFSIFEDRTSWKYQNVVGPIICKSLKKADKVVVQSSWLKRRCIERLGIDESRVEVQAPLLTYQKIPNATPKTNRLFFPTSDLYYKNHTAVFSALDSDLLSHLELKLFVTVDSKSELGQVYKNHSNDVHYIECVGWLNKSDMEKFYRSSILLFPSLVESLGLPLVEAANLGSYIIAPDLEYVQGALGDYPNVSYFRAVDKNSLAACIYDVVSRSASKGW